MELSLKEIASFYLTMKKKIPQTFERMSRLDCAVKTHAASNFIRSILMGLYGFWLLLINDKSMSESHKTKVTRFILNVTESSPLINHGLNIPQLRNRPQIHFAFRFSLNWLDSVMISVFYWEFYKQIFW